MLPGEDSVLLFTVGLGNGVGAGTSEVVVQSLKSDVPKTLFPGRFPRYLRTGHIVYQADDVLFAVPFDLDSLEVTGGPVALLDGVHGTSFGVQGNAAAYDLSESGSLVCVSGEGEAQRTLVWVDRNGVAEPLETIPPGSYQAPRLSPNEERVLVVADGDVWIYDIATGRRSAVTTDGLGINEAEWDPTGTQVAFSSQRAGPLNVFVQPADGGGTARQLTSLEGLVEVDSWSPNGDVIAAHHHSPEGPVNILMIPVGEEGSAPQDFLVREFAEEGSVFSPDGRYVAYWSNESGEGEVYIRPYPGPGSQVTVSVGGGRKPVWRDGELFYRRTSDDRMMAVSVSTRPELNVGDITELFEGDYWGSCTPRPDYHVTADRSRFLMLTGGDTSLQGEIVVVENWSQELLERVPVN